MASFHRWGHSDLERGSDLSMVMTNDLNLSRACGRARELALPANMPALEVGGQGDRAESESQCSRESSVVSLWHSDYYGVGV